MSDKERGLPGAEKTEAVNKKSGLPEGNKKEKPAEPLPAQKEHNSDILSEGGRMERESKPNLSKLKELEELRKGIGINLKNLRTENRIKTSSAIGNLEGRNSNIRSTESDLRSPTMKYRSLSERRDTSAVASPSKEEKTLSFADEIKQQYEEVLGKDFFNKYQGIYITEDGGLGLQGEFNNKHLQKSIDSINRNTKPVEDNYGREAKVFKDQVDDLKEELEELEKSSVFIPIIGHIIKAIQRAIGENALSNIRELRRQRQNKIIDFHKKNTDLIIEMNEGMLKNSSSDMEPDQAKQIARYAIKQATKTPELSQSHLENSTFSRQAQSLRQTTAGLVRT